MDKPRCIFGVLMILVTIITAHTNQSKGKILGEFCIMNLVQNLINFKYIYMVGHTQNGSP